MKFDLPTSQVADGEEMLYNLPEVVDQLLTGVDEASRKEVDCTRYQVEHIDHRSNLVCQSGSHADWVNSLRWICLVAC